MGWPNHLSRKDAKTGSCVFRPKSVATAFTDALTRLGKRKSIRLRGTETILARCDGEDGEAASVVVRYHETNVVEYMRDGCILVRDGGWNTPSTHQKIQEYVPGVTVYGAKPDRHSKSKSCTHVRIQGPWPDTADTAAERELLRACEHHLHLRDEQDVIVVWPDGLGREDETHAQIVARAVMMRLEIEELRRNPPAPKAVQLDLALPHQPLRRRSRLRRYTEQQRILDELHSHA